MSYRELNHKLIDLKSYFSQLHRLRQWKWGEMLFHPVRKRSEWISDAICQVVLLFPVIWPLFKYAQTVITFPFSLLLEFKTGQKLSYLPQAECKMVSVKLLCLFSCIKWEEGQDKHIHSDPLLHCCSCLWLFPDFTGKRFTLFLFCVINAIVSLGHCNKMEWGLERAEQRQLWVI